MAEVIPQWQADAKVLAKRITLKGMAQISGIPYDKGPRALKDLDGKTLESIVNNELNVDQAAAIGALREVTDEFIFPIYHAANTHGLSMKLKEQKYEESLLTAQLRIYYEYIGNPRSKKGIKDEDEYVDIFKEKLRQQIELKPIFDDCTKLGLKQLLPPTWH